MPTRTDEGEAVTQLILETFRLNGAMLETGNRITEPYGLTSARWQVMGAVQLASQPLTVAQIARRMGLARQGVRRIVKDLIDLDMIYTESNLDHKRSPLLSLTDKGNEVLASIDKAQAEWVNQLAEGLSKRQINAALKILQTVRERSGASDNA
jgi:DNA-binding MarR family transcriptional regulator